MDLPPTPSPLRLGPYALANRHILAPMAGVSEMPFRRIAIELGAALAPTELVSAAGLARASARTQKYLRHDPAVEHPFSVQLFGGDPAEMADAAAIAQKHGAQVLDINMGCPVPKVTRNGAGSALMCDPARASAVVRAMAERTGLPVTAKIRSGWDASRVNAVEVAQALEAGGAVAVALHPRTRAQGYSGRADWSVIAAVKRAVRIPVISSGDVRSPQDAARCFAETGCDAVMVGRAALGNPWIFRELLGGPPPSPEERCAGVLRHLADHLAFAGEERRAVHQFRKHLLWYAHGLQGASAFRAQACVVEGADQVRRVAEAFFLRALPDGRDGSGAEVDLRAAYG